jgi:SOS-response transcriptional repressor LexA
MTTAQQGLTTTQRTILAAVEQGHTKLDAIARATGIASKSTIAYHLKRMEQGGHIVLDHRVPNRTRIDDGREYCEAWDTMARLAGNPDA